MFLYPFVVAGLCVASVVTRTLPEGMTLVENVKDAQSGQAAQYRYRRLPFVARGLAAMKQILPDAKQLDTSTASVRQYEKNGDFQTAKTDFFSFNPKNVRDKNSNTHTWNHRPMYGQVLIGTAGNTRLILREGIRDKPTVLDIIHLKMDPEPAAVTDRIFYRSESN